MFSISFSSEDLLNAVRSRTYKMTVDVTFVQQHTAVDDNEQSASSSSSSSSPPICASSSFDTVISNRRDEFIKGSFSNEEGMQGDTVSSIIAEKKWVSICQRHGMLPGCFKVVVWRVPGYTRSRDIQFFLGNRLVAQSVHTALKWLKETYPKKK